MRKSFPSPYTTTLWPSFPQYIILKLWTVVHCVRDDCPQSYGRCCLDCLQTCGYKNPSYDLVGSFRLIVMFYATSDIYIMNTCLETYGCMIVACFYVFISLHNLVSGTVNGVDMIFLNMFWKWDPLEARKSNNTWIYQTQLYYILNKEIQEFLVNIKMLFLRHLEIFISYREINLCRLDTFRTMVAKRPIMYSWVPAFGLLWILLCLQLQLYTSHK